jgi:phosphonate transport system permease protein
MRRSERVSTSFGFLGVGLFCLVFADLSVSTLDPWQEMARMARGLVTPDFLAVDRLGEALLQTLAFALLGVALAVVAGFGLALVFHVRLVRWGCAFVRAIHELFWALLFLQMLGLTPLTGILAIALPYAGIFAKVYAEILEEAGPRAAHTLPAGSGTVSAFFFARLPDAFVHLKSYTFYRVECGLRSSAVLGFVGLPTLGFYLESAFKQGHYSEVSALLFLFYVVIATLRLWMRPRLAPVYLLIAPFVLAGGAEISLDNIVRFFTHDIVPYPLRSADVLDISAWTAFGTWTWELLADQALPGIVATLVLTQIALVGSGVLTLVFFPLVSRRFLGPVGRTAGHAFLVVVRSTPEYILAYVLLQFWGPSMLPAIVALSLHNGAIIGHLVGRFSDELALRPDHPRGLDLYAYEVVPRVYGQFLAFLFYRWEVILRETAILGILGIQTLGFYVDSAIAEIRLDRAMFLIVITALLNIAVDGLSRAIRARLRLTTTPEIQ